MTIPMTPGDALLLAAATFDLWRPLAVLGLLAFVIGVAEYVYGVAVPDTTWNR